MQCSWRFSDGEQPKIFIYSPSMLNKELEALKHVSRLIARQFHRSFLNSFDRARREVSTWSENILACPDFVTFVCAAAFAAGTELSILFPVGLDTITRFWIPLE